MDFSRRNATQPLPPAPDCDIDLGLVEEFHGRDIDYRGMFCTYRACRKCVLPSCLMRSNRSTSHDR